MKIELAESTQGCCKTMYCRNSQSWIPRHVPYSYWQLSQLPPSRPDAYCYTEVFLNVIGGRPHHLFDVVNFRKTDDCSVVLHEFIEAVRSDLSNAGG